MLECRHSLTAKTAISVPGGPWLFLQRHWAITRQKCGRAATHKEGSGELARRRRSEARRKGMVGRRKKVGPKGVEGKEGE